MGMHIPMPAGVHLNAVFSWAGQENENAGCWLAKCETISVIFEVLKVRKTDSKPILV